MNIIKRLFNSEKLTKSFLYDEEYIEPTKPTKPITFEEATKILDIFGWKNFEHIEIECVKEDNGYITHDKEYQVSKQIIYTLAVSEDRLNPHQPLRKGITSTIINENDMDQIRLYVYFKDKIKYIDFNLTTHVLELWGGLSITMDQMKEKIGFPLREIIIK